MDDTNLYSEKKLNIAVMAHVDAGKTTLSEAFLYTSGAIRSMGRVDDRNAYLDTEPMERERGITIFSKQAVMSFEGTDITLLDTPGHVDFGAEAERTLQVLDAAVLVVSGTKGVQGHTRTLWMLLERYGIPVFIFVNKMDRDGTDKDMLLSELRSVLDSGCVDFTDDTSDTFFEEAALCGEELLEQFLENGAITRESIADAVLARRIFPCMFGSALKLSGVDAFMKTLVVYARQPKYGEKFGAKVFKITRDGQGKRVTYLKVTGGCLKTRDMIDPEYPDEKVNQIRIYSGRKFQTVNEAAAGTICAVTGPDHTFPGMGLGAERQTMPPLLAPVMTYKVILPEGCDAMSALPVLKQLEEEDPALHVLWDETLKEIHVQIMGEVQLEILKRLISERSGIEAGFGAGSIIYKETIQDTVEGVGHFEPLRHYAEVHLKLEPLPRGSGVQLETCCSTDVLDKNWQRLILAHLGERDHPGVLTGAAVTDIKITLLTGRAHQKHTECGDFREAAYRAVRQGLKQAVSVLLEPYYDFVLEVPADNVGAALTDMERLCAVFELKNTSRDTAVIHGYAPTATMQHYQKEVAAYTKGRGRLELLFRGYEECHDPEDVIGASGYDPERDTANPTGSIFCAHGSGFSVSWDKVKNYMHIESVLDKTNGVPEQPHLSESMPSERSSAEPCDAISQEEIEQIFSETFNRNKKNKGDFSGYKKRPPVMHTYGSDRPPGSVRYERDRDSRHYLLIDGYNVIFAWPELKELAEVTIDGARGRLLDIMCNYQGIKKCELIVVFDAYRVAGHKTEYLDHHNIHVVYTREAETADQYIERFAHDNAKKHYVTVVTSDGLEQIIIRGEGCMLISAREFESEVKNAEDELRRLLKP